MPRQATEPHDSGVLDVGAASGAGSANDIAIAERVPHGRRWRAVSFGMTPTRPGSLDPDVLLGKPAARGTCLSVEFLLGLPSAMKLGYTVDESIGLRLAHGPGADERARFFVARGGEEAEARYHAGRVLAYLTPLERLAGLAA